MIDFSWHWVACVRRLAPLNEEIMPPDIHPGSSNITDETFFDNEENLLLREFVEVLANFTIGQKYSKTVMITLKLMTQSGSGMDDSGSIRNMLMTSFFMLAGWIYATYVLIIVSNIMMATANSKTKFEAISREVDAFCEAKQLSPELTDKIQTFYKYKFKKRYFNEEAIKQSTATSLRKEIKMHSCAHLITKVQLFKDLPELLLENVISCLTMDIYFPNDIIIQAGVVGDSMFFIAFGTAGIYSIAGKSFTSASKTFIAFCR